MTLIRQTTALVLAAALVAAAAPLGAAEDHSHHQHHGDAASGDDPHAAHRAAAAKQSMGETIEIRLSDSALLTQDGQEVKFKSDLVGDRIVVVDFIYTTCTTVCPVLSALMENLQGRFGDAMGKEVGLVSVTVDPLRDTPQRLKAFSEKHHAGSGWTFVTGRKPQVDDVLKAFGAFTPNYSEHPPLVMVGDGRTGRWVRFFGFPSPDQIEATVEQLRAARRASAG